MNGLPSATDLGFLIARELVQVAVGAFQVQLHFEGSVCISIEARCEIDGVSAAAGVEAGRLVLGLIGKVVSEARPLAERHLALTFNDGSCVTVLESDEPFESYSITGPHGTWVV